MNKNYSTDTQKGSVIPEAFISEMLALQDYSQGLSKVSDVIPNSRVTAPAIDQELTPVTSRKQQFDGSLPTIAPADPALAEPTPIEEAIADLRQAILSSSIGDRVPSRFSQSCSL